MTAHVLLSPEPPAATDADVLVVGLRPRPSAAAPAGSAGDASSGSESAGSPRPSGPVPLEGTALPADVLAALADLAASVGATGAVDETTRLPAPAGVAASTVLTVGIGPRDPADAETLRRAAGAAARALAGVAAAGLALPAPDPERRAAVLEGALVGAYTFDAYRSTPKPALATVVLPGSDPDDAADAALARRARTVAAAVHRARDWVNTPAADLPPAALAAQVEEAGRAAGLQVRVLDEVQLDAQGYGGILGVGRGSVNPPRLVRLAYRPDGATAHLAIVGKGITFDTGGLSLKPSEAMTTMKCDMSGAAAAAAAVLAAADLGLPVAVTVYAALAENMPSGLATRPSDVLRMYGGRTVEVLNTDAEGRLVMADALVRAAEDSPDLLVDVATLTGACTVALGQRVAGVMSPDDATREQVVRAAGRAGESVWPLPIPEEMRAKLDSSVADLANIGDRYGGALQAAAFLAEFVPDGVRWAHLDIAGPAFNSEKPHGYTPKGGTGFAVRTLLALAESMA